MYLKGLKWEVALNSLLSDCKNLQKSVLTNVNIQRTGKTSLQMFVYLIFDGSFICRCLYIFRPSSVPRHSIYSLQLETYTLIISYLYLQILHSASESDFMQRKAYYMQIWLVNRMISSIKNCAHFCRFLNFNFDICRLSPILSPICPPK